MANTESTSDNKAADTLHVGESSDGLFKDQAPVLRLDKFEGPLDLLYFLIRKNEIDIYDIPIAEVTRQYIEILHGNEELNIEVAGDFFVMAATLMYIKSRMLLPTSESAKQEDLPDDSDEIALDPRWQLVKQLIQYKRLKESTQYLAKLIDERQNFLDRRIAQPEQPAVERPLETVGDLDIWNAFNRVLRQLSERILPGEINEDSYTIAEQMSVILKRLEQEKSFTFSSLMPEKISIPLLATTFLACLELARLHKMHIRQDELFGEIYCSVEA
ncbi:MAG: segregation/condensation protein A [Opitutales bacterium]|nr:segregation/condensation protein A [Opitutales bacterium]